MRAWWLCIVVLCVGLVPTRSQAGDRLDAARSAAGASSSRSSSSSSSGGYDDDDDDGAGSIVLGILSAFASDDDSDDDVAFRPSAAKPVVDDRRGFLPYPYADGRPGYMVRAAPDEDVEGDTHHAAFRFSAEGAYLYEDVWRSSAQFRLMVPRFYTQFRYDLFLEGPTPMLDGDLEVHGKVRDRLHFANVELGPQLFAGEHLAVRVGLLGNIMFDDRRSLPEDPTTTPGIGGALEFDLYPVRPLVISGRGAIQRLGDTVMMEARGTIGVSINRLEVFAGYDHRQIGKVHLGGPTAGLAVRF